MTLSQDLFKVADQLSALEAHVKSMSTMLDRVLDLHNDLTDWATNTDDEKSAMEVMGILEMYVQKAPNSSNVTVSTR